MRIHVLIAGLATVFGSTGAPAATILVFTDPMTMDRRTVVVESKGPDRAFVCMLPPGDAGCRAVPIKRARR